MNTNLHVSLYTNITTMFTNAIFGIKKLVSGKILQHLTTDTKNYDDKGAAFSSAMIGLGT